MPDEIEPDFPALFKNATMLVKLLADNKMQVAMGNHGSRYKKQQAYKDHGRMQSPLYAKEGKEETMAACGALIAATLKKAKCNPPAGPLQTVCENSWLYGLAPELTGVSQTPNSLGMLKLLVNGCQQWLAFEVCSLLHFIREDKRQEKINWPMIEEFLEAADYPKLKAMKDGGVIMRSAEQCAKEAIYIPSGWIVAERVVTGTLIYGARVSVLAVTDKMLEAYASLRGVLAETPNKCTKNMDTALKQMQELHDRGSGASAA